MAQIPISGSNSHFYVVEVRRKVGYDVKLPGEAVIIHEVLTSRQEPAHVIDIDGNGNTGDTGAMWTVGETFLDAPNGISVHIDSQTATGYVITISSGVAPPPATPGTYDDKASPWAYTTTWANITVTSAYAGGYKTSSSTGAMATVYFSGVQAKLFFTKNSSMGKLDVYVDDVKVAQINQYSLTQAFQKTWLSAVYPDGVHKIQFVRASAKVNVDAIQVIAAPPPPAPVGPGTYENTNLNWAFSGAWSKTTLSGASGGSVQTSSGVSNSASLLVNSGSGFILRYFTRKGFGTLDVYVDNIKVTSLNQSSGTLVTAWKTYTLSLTSGTHTIKLVDASGKVNFDNIVISP